MAGAYGKCWAQKRQVRKYVCLEGAGNRGENVEKGCIPVARAGRKTWSKRGKYRITGASRRNEREAGHGRMTEEEEEEDEEEEEEEDDDDDDDGEEEDDEDDDDHRDHDDVNKVYKC